MIGREVVVDGYGPGDPVLQGEWHFSNLLLSTVDPKSYYEK